MAVNQKSVRKTKAKSRTATLVNINNDVVDTVKLPPFKTEPQVIIWGTRVFTLRVSGAWKEAFVYCVPDIRKNSQHEYLDEAKNATEEALRDDDSVVPSTKSSPDS